MPIYDSPFGSLPTNLPQPKGLPAPMQVQAHPQTPMMPDLGAMMQPRQEQQQTARPPSDIETVMGSLAGLWKQSREDTDKQKAKSLLEQLLELKNQRTPMNSDGTFKPATNAEEKLPRDFASADVDAYTRRAASFESGDNPYAVNKGSGATGTYQFLPSTWRWIAKEAPELGLTETGITDAVQQAKAMRYYTNKSQRILEPILGRKPTGGELYLLHLLGHSGGPAVLSDLDAPITKTISEGAYKGNPFLRQYTTGRDLIAGLNSTFGGGGK